MGAFFKRAMSVLALSFQLFLPSHQASLHLCEGFLPPNDMKIPAGREGMSFGADSITQASFERLIGDMERHFSPWVSRYGGRLVIEKNWNDSTVNAFAKRQGSTYIVSMLGGLARHPQMTLDGLALVVCHEIGHHIGGVPQYSGAGNTWASTEGQSDYFATLKCLRDYFAAEPNHDVSRAPASVREECAKRFSDEVERVVCARSALAGLSGASLFWALKGGGPQPDFTTPDPSVVSSTYESHPAYQCRLDTYYAGAACEAPLETPIGQSDYRVGTCDRSAVKEAGGRPRCWFAPPGGGGGGPNPNPIPNPQPNPQPNPGQIAPTPTIQGMTQVRVSNPNMLVPIALDVSAKPGAVGVLLEISKPGATFANPNGDRPDPVGGLGFESARGTRHVYSLVPARMLPGWGVYRIRLLALDAQGRALGRFSNEAVMELRP